MPARRRVRHALVSAVVVFSIAVLALASSSPLGRPAPPPRLTLLYVGAEDCPPCRAWQGGAGRDFRASADFARLSYREAEAPTTRDVLNDAYWPPDLRFAREAIDASAAAVPLWLVVVDDRVVFQAFGLTQWHEAILPRIRALLR